MTTSPMGFAGLLARRSDISGVLESLAAEPAAAPHHAAPSSGASAPPPRSDGSRARLGWIVAVAGGIALFIWVANSGSPGSSVPATTQATTPVPDSPVAITPAADLPASPASVTESAPPVGEGQQLGVDQIAYCLAEKVRLEAAQERVDTTVHPQVAAFNSAVDDFNSRCSNYQYLPADKARAEEYVSAQRQALAAAGAARVAAAAQLSPVPEGTGATDLTAGPSPP